MRQIFISNIRVRENETADIIISDVFEFTNFSVNAKSGNSVYIIDVHCCFNYSERKLNLQDQGGVILYRRLLNQFIGDQEKLKGTSKNS